MLPDATRVGRVVLQIADLDRSLGFYRDVLGFQVSDRSGTGTRVAELGVPGQDEILLELREKPGVKPVPARGLIGLYHFAVLLPSRAALGRFVVHAANAGVRLASADHLVSEALYLVDPDGLTVEVYRDRARLEWQYAGDELQMASLPLNFDAVVGAASDAPPWQGLPDGTTMGHLHFYVKDLGRAEAFYCGELGFEPTLRSFPGALFASAGGYHHHVGMNTWAAHMPTATDNDARLLSWEIVVPAGTVQPRVSTDPWGIEARVVTAST